MRYNIRGQSSEAKNGFRFGSRRRILRSRGMGDPPSSSFGDFQKRENLQNEETGTCLHCLPICEINCVSPEHFPKE